MTGEGGRSSRGAWRDWEEGGDGEGGKGERTRGGRGEREEALLRQCGARHRHSRALDPAPEELPHLLTA